MATLDETKNGKSAQLQSIQGHSRPKANENTDPEFGFRFLTTTEAFSSSPISSQRTLRESVFP